MQNQINNSKQRFHPHESAAKIRLPEIGYEIWAQQMETWEAPQFELWEPY